MSEQFQFPPPVDSTPFQFQFSPTAASSSSSTDSTPATSRSDIKSASHAASSASSALKRRQLIAGVRKEKRAETFSKRRRGVTGQTEEQKVEADKLASSITPAQVNSLFQQLQAHETTREQRAQILKNITNLLASENAPYHLIVQCGGVKTLIKELTCADSTPAMQLDVLWCLSNIASDTTEHTRAVIPAAPYFITLLQSEHTELIEQSTWAIGNLASEDDSIRETLIANGALSPLIAKLPITPVTENDVSLVRIVAWCLSNICKCKLFPLADLMTSDLPSRLFTHFNSTDQPIATEIAWIIATVTTHTATAVSHLFTAGFVPVLLQRLHTLLTTPEFRAPQSDVAVATSSIVDTGAATFIPLIRILGNICHGSDTDIDAIYSVDGGRALLLDTLARGLSSTHRGLKKESIWALSNLAASEQFVESVVAGNFIAPITHILLHAQFDIQREAAYVLCNIACAREYTFLPLVLQASERIIPAFLGLLRVHDSEAIVVGLRFIDTVLHRVPDGMERVEAADGIDALETLQTHDNSVFWQHASRLIDEFWGVSENDLREQRQEQVIDYPAWRLQAQQR